MSDLSVKHIVVHGRVQGVGYRAFVEHEALQAGIAGWVRNRRDGSVEAVLQGKPEIIEAVIESCRRGPFAARVEAVDIATAQPDALALVRRGERFSVLPTT